MAASGPRLFQAQHNHRSAYKQNARTFSKDKETMKHKSLIPILLLALILQVACANAVSNLRFGVTTAKPIVQSLVPGVITQERADTIKRDLDDGLAGAVKCDHCWKAITSTGRQKDLAKAECALTAANDLRAILARHNIRGNEKLDLIAAIIQAAIDAFQDYHDTIVSPADAAVDSGAAEKRLREKLENLNRQLKELK
jgi:hypothetical protein